MPGLSSPSYRDLAACSYGSSYVISDKRQLPLVSAHNHTSAVVHHKTVAVRCAKVEALPLAPASCTCSSSQEMGALKTHGRPGHGYQGTTQSHDGAHSLDAHRLQTAPKFSGLRILGMREPARMHD